MTPCRQFSLRVLLGLTLLATPAASIAQPSQPTAEAKLAARALADKGWEFFNAGRYEEALTAFRDAEAQVHAPPFLVMAARSCERLGRLLEARSFYQRVLDDPLAASAPQAFQQAQHDAKNELADLMPRIPTLKVAVRGTARAAVQLSVGGQRIAPETPVPRDPGEHTVVVTVPGRAAVPRTIRLKERAGEYIVIELASPPAAAPSARSVPADSGEGLRKVMLIGGGVSAGAGMIAGTVCSRSSRSGRRATRMTCGTRPTSIPCSAGNAPRRTSHRSAPD